MLELALLILWLAWCAQAVLSALQVMRFGHKLSHPRRSAYAAYRPRAAVIVPFKGLEASLQRNLRGLCEQDYADYRLVLVVESKDDPAYPVLLREAARYPQREIDVLVAGLTEPVQSQKVHNQLTAIAHLRAHARGEQVWAFADSDAVPGPQWLGDLVGPLGQPERTGVTTGYRWLVPEATSGRPIAIWSHLASVMNSSVACFMGHERFNHAWGGSMALRVDAADRAGLEDYLRGSITDDYPMSRLARDLNLRVYFVRHCLVATPVNFTWSELVNFAHRQYLITRVHTPRLYLSALAVLVLYAAGFLTAWASLIVELLRAPTAGRWLVPMAAMAVVFLANQWRAVWRRVAVRRAFGEATARRLRTALWLDHFATPLWMGLHLLLMLRAALGRAMVWRGIRYRLRSATVTERLSDS